MAILDKVKIGLRTTTTDTNLESQINTLIDSTKEDLSLGGVHSDWLPDEPADPIIIQCIVCYVCWQYFNDIDITESDKWMKAYNLHRQKIHNRYKYREAVT